jgi:RNA polymerase sigma factor (sigma-70 family)
VSPSKSETARFAIPLTVPAAFRIRGRLYNRKSPASLAIRVALAPKPPPDPSSADADERFTRFLREYGQVLRRAVRSVCPHALGVQAEEIEQDARMRLWRALRRESVVRDPTSYLFRVAATAAIDAVRQIRARRETSLTSPDEAHVGEQAEPIEPRSTPEQAAIHREAVERAYAAIDSLPENRRQAVRLHLQGFTSAEIASVLGWTEAKARNLVSRGLEQVRRALRETAAEAAGQLQGRHEP